MSAIFQQLKFSVQVPPDENLAQLPRQLVGNELLRVGQLQVEVAVRADQPALVFSLGPLQADDDILIDEVLEHRTGIDWYEAHRGGCVLWSGWWKARDGLANLLDVLPTTFPA